MLGPVYRFVSQGPTSPSQVALDAGHIGVLSDDGLGRMIVGPDGSVERAAMLVSEPLLTSVPVPSRLGGGFLFWNGGMLYRARSFLGPLEPIVTLPTNALGVQFGPESVFLSLPDSPLQALALEPPRRVGLSPRGVTAIASSDDGRAIAIDGAGRALASTDAGKTWKDVTSQLAGPAHGVLEDGTGVGLELTRGVGSWLEKDGQFVQRAGASAGPSPAQAKAELWRRVVASGVPLPTGRALVSTGSAAVAFDLRSASASAPRPAGPKGSSCLPLSPDDEGILVCFSYAPQETRTIVSHALAAAPRLEKTFDGAPRVLSDHTLSVVASCSGAPLEGAACIRQPGGAWAEVRMSDELLKDWQPLYWVPRATGGLAVIARERRAQAPRISLIDPVGGGVTPWHATFDQVMPLGTRSIAGSNLLVLADGTLRGFTDSAALEISADGQLSRDTHGFVSVSSSSARALARDDRERLWQTSDYGQSWLEVAPPPFDSTFGGVGSARAPSPAGQARRIDCSPVGCVIEHGSGVGNWLRIGWPEDPPRARARIETKAGDARAPETPIIPPVQARLPELRCVTRSGRPLLDATAWRAPTQLGPAAETAVVAEKNGSSRRGRTDYPHVTYGDVFGRDQTFLQSGLRATVHVRAADGTPVAALIQRKAPLEVSFVEPFDPTAPVRHVTASFGAWATTRAGERNDAAPLELESSSAFARPVLSEEPGHSGGVLLAAGDLSLFAPKTGPARPLRPGCVPVSGFVNRQGTLFVACTVRGGRTTVEELPQGSMRWQLPAAGHFSYERRPGMLFVPPGSPEFPNPDAVTVAADGVIRVVRLPAGDEPPTSDNPAWLLADGAAPIELAPWSTLEVATSPACRNGDGYRALVQTSKPWFNVADATAFVPPSGMSVLVRWSRERICLEAVEVGFLSLRSRSVGSQALRISAVARFVGTGSGAAFVGAQAGTSAREPARCELGQAP